MINVFFFVKNKQHFVLIIKVLIVLFMNFRSIYERALDVDHRNITLWLKYTEMEMRNRQVNHARNLWDRAVTILPRANQFWYKYTYMEEMLENIAGKSLSYF